MKKEWKVEVIESERGWGQKVDEVHWFTTEKKAKKFQDEINEPNRQNILNGGSTPDWYMFATDPEFCPTPKVK